MHREDSVTVQWNFFEKILNEVDSLVFVRDADGVFVYLNEQFARFLNKDVSDIQGKNANEIYDNTEHYIRAIDQDKYILSQPEGFTVKNEEASVTNPKLWMQVNKRKIVIDDQSYVLGLLVDVSELKNAESKLTKSNAELNETIRELTEAEAKLVHAEKMISIGHVAAGLAHEMGNPLNYVKGNVHPLRQNVQELEELFGKVKTETSAAVGADLESGLNEIKHLLSGVEEGSDRLYDLLNSLMDFAETTNQDMVSCNLNELVHASVAGYLATLSFVEPQAEDSIVVKEELSESLPKVFCSDRQVSQVLHNLLLNAREALVDDTGTLIVSTRYDDKYVYVDISDDGRGISRKDQERIFEPFFTTKEVGNGVGLGLSISMSIMSRFGGTITVKSKRNAGSTFTLSFPIHAAEENSE